MSNDLVNAHILGQQRLRQLVAAAVERAWTSLPAHHSENVDQFLSQVVPTVLAGQRSSVALTEAFLARSLERQPTGVDKKALIGSAVRSGATPEEVYRRPFVTVWADLEKGSTLEAALLAGLARATGTAATDVQLSMRATLRAVGNAEDLILGYQRVPDMGACDLCRLVADQRYHTDQLFPIHAHCGCGVKVITGPERPNFTGRYDRDLAVTRDGLTAAVAQHGELGPLLVNGDDHFTQL